MLVKTVIPFLDDHKDKIKIHFARGGKIPKDALRAFISGEFKEWQENQKNKNFERRYILSLIWLGDAEWLFAGVYESLDVKQSSDDRFRYKTKLTVIGSDLIGRMIVRYKRNFRQSYCFLERYLDEIEVVEIRRNEYSLPFPGYDQVSIAWKDLYAVINTESWRTALQNLKGVYLITDVSNGMMYVGSATGNDMLWGRWKSYIDTGHGGNKDLKKLKLGYIQENFQYSILDVYKANTDDEVIIEREQWWKNVLMTREYGYNMN